jgi:hypothetical protein
MTTVDEAGLRDDITEIVLDDWSPLVIVTAAFRKVRTEVCSSFCIASNARARRLAEFRLSL